MKKLISVLTLSAVMMLPMGLSAKNSNEAITNPKHENVEIVFSDDFAECKIEVEGFSASGRCSEVLRAYKRWKRMQ